ncbi:MAG: hypothetical protein AAGH99_04585 [Planctomycetota bacterium]
MRYIVATGLCLLTGWALGALLGRLTWDPFDDDLWAWVWACTLYLGTLISVVLIIIVLPGIYIKQHIRRNARS